MVNGPGLRSRDTTFDDLSHQLTSSVFNLVKLHNDIVVQMTRAITSQIFLHKN